MSARRNFILFELNEVPLRVVHHYARARPRSAFARLLRHGRRWDTVTPDQGHLSPWITWPTLHRGVASSDHHIVALGQDLADADRHYPPVWTLLAAAGRKVGLFGSLHSYPVPAELDNFSFYVPDTFAAGAETKPAALSAFQQFNLQMVDRSGRNVSNGVPVRDALAFLMRSVPEGIRAATLAKVARQLAGERIWRDRTGRRRTIQSLLAFDLFLAQLNAHRPDAAFFFTNHVASSMHRYWPATFRDDYRVTDWSDAWVERFSREIDYVMGEADQMLAELIAFAERDPRYVVLVAGSMGQEAVDDPSFQTRTEVLARDIRKFVEANGVTGQFQRRRTMEPTYTLEFDEPADADRLHDALGRLRIGGQNVEHRRLAANGVEFVLGHKNIADDELTILVGNHAMGADAAGLANVTIDDEVGSAAYHVPEGMLLAFDPQHNWRGAAGRSPVPTTGIAPSLLALLGVEAPAYMGDPIDSLVAMGLSGTVEAAA